MQSVGHGALGMRPRSGSAHASSTDLRSDCTARSRKALSAQPCPRASLRHRAASSPSGPIASSTHPLSLTGGAVFLSTSGAYVVEKRLQVSILIGSISPYGAYFGSWFQNSSS